jgi:hypothetical protein
METTVLFKTGDKANLFCVYGFSFFSLPGVKDYHMSVEQRPAIPYDASKKPGKAALKKLPVGNQNNKRKKLHK